MGSPDTDDDPWASLPGNRDSGIFAAVRSGLISFFRGPGGFWRRFLAEGVPFITGMALGNVSAAFVGLVPGIAVGVVAWIALSALIRAVRRRPKLCLAYRLAILAHVAFWTWQGIAATRHDAPQPAVQAGRSVWAGQTTVRAGFATRVYELPAHASLAGWGQRPRRICFPAFGGFGVLGRLTHDLMRMPTADGAPRRPMLRTPEEDAGDLGARAFVLRTDGEGAPLAIVRLDVVTVDRDLVAAVHAGVADLGFRPEGVVVAATHTHSGPGGYSRRPLSEVVGTDHFNDACFEALVRAAVEAVRAADAAAVPAAVAFVATHDRDEQDVPILARNRSARREDEDEIDDRVHALRVDAVEDGRTLGVVLNYAVHPVLLRRDSMVFDRDLVGAIERGVSAALPGTPPVLFLNGALGDVSSQHSPGVGLERARWLAGRFAKYVVPALRAPTAHARVRLAAARRSLRYGTPRFVITAGEREGLVHDLETPWGTTSPVWDAVALPANVVLWSLMVPELRVGVHGLGLGAVANLTPILGEPVFETGALVFEAKDQRWAMLWQPGEATQALGRAWRAMAAERGFDDTMLVGLAGGACAYLTTEETWWEGGYEAQSTVFGPSSGALMGGAMAEALDDCLEQLRE